MTLTASRLPARPASSSETRTLLSLVTGNIKVAGLKIFFRLFLDSTATEAKDLKENRPEAVGTATDGPSERRRRRRDEDLTGSRKEREIRKR